MQRFCTTCGAQQGRGEEICEILQGWDLRGGIQTLLGASHFQRWLPCGPNLAALACTGTGAGSSYSANALWAGRAGRYVDEDVTKDQIRPEGDIPELVKRELVGKEVRGLRKFKQAMQFSNEELALCQKRKEGMAPQVCKGHTCPMALMQHSTAYTHSGKQYSQPHR